MDEAIRLGVEEPVTYDERGRAHLELGHYQCAESDFDRAITLGLGGGPLLVGGVRRGSSLRM